MIMADKTIDALDWVACPNCHHQILAISIQCEHCNAPHAVGLEIRKKTRERELTKAGDPRGAQRQKMEDLKLHASHIPVGLRQQIKLIEWLLMHPVIQHGVVIAFALLAGALIAQILKLNLPEYKDMPVFGFWAGLVVGTGFFYHYGMKAMLWLTNYFGQWLREASGSMVDQGVRLKQLKDTLEARGTLEAQKEKPKKGFVPLSTIAPLPEFNKKD
jgi:hypothetical protein